MRYIDTKAWLFAGLLPYQYGPPPAPICFDASCADPPVMVCFSFFPIFVYRKGIYLSLG